MKDLAQYLKNSETNSLKDVYSEDEIKKNEELIRMWRYVYCVLILIASTNTICSVSGVKNCGKEPGWNVISRRIGTFISC